MRVKLDCTPWLAERLIMGGGEKVKQCSSGSGANKKKRKIRKYFIARPFPVEGALGDFFSLFSSAPLQSRSGCTTPPYLIYLRN